MRAIWSVQPKMRLSQGVPFKTCANPPASDQNINRANLYENEMVQTYRDLNCAGESPNWGQSYYIPFLLFQTIYFRSFFQETLQHENPLGELITVMR